MSVSLFASSSEFAANEEIKVASTLYPAETVFFNQKPPRSLTIEQVFEVLDESE